MGDWPTCRIAFSLPFRCLSPHKTLSSPPSLFPSLPPSLPPSPPILSFPFPTLSSIKHTLPPSHPPSLSSSLPSSLPPSYPFFRNSFFKPDRRRPDSVVVTASR
jgi:hypothetical protein